MTKKKKSGLLKKIILLLFLVLICLTGFITWKFVLRNNVKLNEGNDTFLFVPKNTDFEGLLQILENDKLVKDIASFKWYAEKMKLPKILQPGKYRLTKGMSNRQIVKMLKQGKEEKVTFTINYTTRSLAQLYEKLCSKLNITETTVASFSGNEELLDRKYGLNSTTLACIVRPGKYELSWATEVEDFFDLMFSIDSLFWNAERLNQLKKLSLNKNQIMTLASIVNCESNIESEQRKIAGVYINRLKENMLLQADPTVIFALNDFTIRRLSFNDLKVDSPYNTYKNKGLPPGPVSFPNEKVINAVLNYEKSSYLYFCAKPELNGYSNFSSTFEEHQKFASIYRDAMNQKKITRN
jgi:UPF0755 protein